MPYHANYERRVPILEVKDTIRVPYRGGVVQVSVRNVGSGVEEMDWYVDDSISTWVHLDGVSEGIGDGFFTLVYEPNPDDTNRLDSIEIFAPETDSMYKVVYIAQVSDSELADIRQPHNTTTHNVLIYPNPATHTVTVEADGIQSAKVYSALGQELLCQKNTGGKGMTLNIEQLPDGFYILAVKTSQGMVYKKVVKTK